LDFWRRLLASGEAGEIEHVRDNYGDIFKWYGANTDIEDRKRTKALLAAEKRTLEMIASGACLADILEGCAKRLMLRPVTSNRQ
jgi:hypothetical protein